MIRGGLPNSPRPAVTTTPKTMPLTSRNTPNMREILAWSFVLFQLLFLLRVRTRNVASTASFSLASFKPQRDDSTITTFLHDANGTRFTKVFHTSSAVENPLRVGNCWCTSQHDDFCSCTPRMSVVVVATSGSDLWCRNGEDLALVGGLNEVGETSAEAALRLLAGEGLVVESPPVLFGVYDEFAFSAAYVVEITVTSRDHSEELLRVPLSGGVDDRFRFEDKTVLNDYLTSLKVGHDFEHEDSKYRALC